MGSAVCLSRAGRILGLNAKTVARKLLHLAAQSESAHRKRMGSRAAGGKIKEIYLDEMITYEHTRCKPIAVAMIVTADREILAFSVEPMPAIGKHLRAISIKKYGKRPNFRARGIKKCLRAVAAIVAEDVRVITDEDRSYARLVSAILPGAQHKTHPSRRAVIAGQGELKDKRFDPLFAINHTFAMCRAFMSRLVRRTWANTKKLEWLRAHLWVYADLHNADLIKSGVIK